MFENKQVEVHSLPVHKRDSTISFVREGPKSGYQVWTNSAGNGVKRKIGNCVLISDGNFKFYSVLLKLFWGQTCWIFWVQGHCLLYGVQNSLERCDGGSPWKEEAIVCGTGNRSKGTRLARTQDQWRKMIWVFEDSHSKELWSSCLRQLKKWTRGYGGNIFFYSRTLNWVCTP